MLENMQREAEMSISVDDIIDHGLVAWIEKYDELVFISLQNHAYAQCSQDLVDFCLGLLDLPDAEQVFIAQCFFTGIITETIRKQSRRRILHPSVLALSFQLMTKINQFETLSDFILKAEWFVSQLAAAIVHKAFAQVNCAHVEKAIRCIHEHLSERFLSVKWLAHTIGISTTHLTNQFKLEMGESVASYIKKRKIDEVIFELTYTNKSLKQIREKYGFDNHSYFIQYFKKYKGMTPLQYKRKLYP